MACFADRRLRFLAGPRNDRANGGGVEAVCRVGGALASPRSYPFDFAQRMLRMGSAPAAPLFWGSPLLPRETRDRL